MSKTRVSRKLLDVARGLFVLRYADADDGRNPPLVSVSTTDDVIHLILHPELDSAELREPGASLVVRAEDRGQLLIEVAASAPNGSLAASIQLENLYQAPLPIESDIMARPQPSRRPAAPTAARGSVRGGGDAALTITAHVAGIGDTVVNGNTWIAGPSAPARIEGLSIDWPDMPEGVILRYAAKPAKTVQPVRMVEAGTFAGTRRRATPLLGFALELTGPRASDYEIVAEAAFLGAPLSKGRGQRVVFSGPTGREPLVGLKVHAQPIQAPQGAAGHEATDADDPFAAPPPVVASRPPSSSRVRVFRSRTKADGTET